MVDDLAEFITVVFDTATWNGISMWSGGLFQLVSYEEISDFN